MWTDIGEGLLHTLAYVGVGGAILILGFLVHDIVTPGKLGELNNLIYNKRNLNAMIVRSSHLVASGLIVSMAIWRTETEFGRGLATTAVFGALGVVILALTEIIIDKFTPGDLRTLLTEERFHPVSALMASSNVVIGLIVAVSIS